MSFPRSGRRLALNHFAVAALASRLALLFVVVAGAFALSALPVRAEGKSAVLVIDANTGNTLYASSADEPRYPASLTKMMTLYMVFDLIERGKLSYQTPIRISANATGAAPSKLDLKEGEEIALIDAIRVLITKSANDVAIAVAEHIGGTEANFARLMTQKAHQIGMTATHFRNASGLPDPAQVTTARDMATLALRLQDEFPQHYVLFGTRTFTYKGETFRNHNTLLFHYEGADGIKTGYTRASGFNLVSSVRRGNKHVVGVIFGGASAATRNNAMRTYLNMGLMKASPVRTRKGVPMLVARKPAPDRMAAVPTPRPVPHPVDVAKPAETVEPVVAQRAEAVAARPELTMVRVKPVPMPGAGVREPLNETTQAERLAMPARAAAPGAPPSTLEAQAQRIARGAPPVVQTAAAHVPAAKARPIEAKQVVAKETRVGSRAQVQIGAFPSVQEAERQLAALKGKAAMLAHAKPVTQPVQQGEKTLYRARYAGLEPAAATQACEELKQQGLACLVFKSE
ncbi:MAG: D-alanyl-D-alanine carboxypeptidase [Hyphomicrobiales bacterium]|nr:MAG: D-alanyl-D-alanine carboxypeptidase [Hyphomicrobiales bacterium]